MTAPAIRLPAPLPVGRNLPYQLSMLSDWHPGTGAGRPGDVDRLVIRDEDGLPYVPAKTMTGVWRDACEVAARALDRHEPDGLWSAWVEVAFGSQPGRRGALGRPRSATVEIRRARYGEEFRAAVAGDGMLGRAVTFLKPGVKIDTTGRAEAGMLRFEEQARIGAVLHGVLRLQDVPAAGADIDPDYVVSARRTISALLLAGAGVLDQLGGKRRRGNGRCRLSLAVGADSEPGRPPDPDLNLETWWQWLATALPPPIPPVVAPRRVLPRPRATSQTPGDGWEAARLRIDLVDPVVSAGRTLGNEVLGRDFIPGGTLLPAVLDRLGPAAADALLAGHLIVTDATVAIGGAPGLPAPRTFAEVKDEPAPRKIVNRGMHGAPEGRQLKQLKRGYVAASAPLRLVFPRLVMRTHNSVSDEMQRPTTDEGGGVFAYRALAPGTTLAAEVRVRSGVLPVGWQAKLSGQYTVGQSRKDDYGRIDVCSIPEQVAGKARRSRWSAQSRQGSPGRYLTVWLVSDLLVRDARLRLTDDPEVLRQVLERALGLPPNGLLPVAGAGGLRPTALVGRRTESWQARWELPRPTLCGFGAGSVAAFELDDGAELDLDAVARIEVEGVGERRGEGFGQVLFATEDGPELVAAFAVGRPEPAEPSVRAVSDGTAPAGAAGSSATRRGPRGPSADQALQALEVEAWRAEIHDRAELLAATPEGRKRIFGSSVHAVTATQLALLREVLPGLTDDSARTAAAFERLADRSRRRAWPPDVAESTSALLNQPDHVWQLLTWTRHGLREQLWAEAVQAVVLTGLTALRRAQESGKEAR